MFTDGVPDPKVMAEMTLPLIKAVADAGRLRISEGVSLDEDKTSKNSASGGDLQQRNMLDGLDNMEGDLPEGVFQNTEFDSGQTNREVFREEDKEKESTEEDRVKELSSSAMKHLMFHPQPLQIIQYSARLKNTIPKHLMTRRSCPHFSVWKDLTI